MQIHTLSWDQHHVCICNKKTKYEKQSVSDFLGKIKFPNFLEKQTENKKEGGKERILTSSC